MLGFLPPGSLGRSKAMTKMLCYLKIWLLYANFELISCLWTFFLPSQFWVILFNRPDNDDSRTKNPNQTYAIIKEYMKNQMLSTFFQTVTFNLD